MKKRIWNIVLTLCLGLGLMAGFTPPASAEVTVWDGGFSVVDINAPYDKDANPLAISSAKDLAYLAQRVNLNGIIQTITYTDSTGAEKPRRRRRQAIS